MSPDNSSPVSSQPSTAHMTELASQARMLPISGADQTGLLSVVSEMKLRIE